MIDFLHPERLFLLLLLLPLLVLLNRAERTRIYRLRVLSVVAQFQSVRILLPLFIIALLLLAIARPYWGFKDIQVQSEGRDIVVAVDVSYSMMASDVSPNRLEVAKRKIFDLIDLANQRRLPLRIGIVTFAGSAFRYCPLTIDLEVARTFAAALTPDIMSSRGSSIEQAIQSSLQLLAQVKSTSGAILLLSDGEDLQFSLNNVESAIKASGTPIFAIGIGKSEGVPISTGTGRFYTNYKGDIVITKLDEVPLKSLAQTSNGTYAVADLAGADISKVISSLPVSAQAGIASHTIRSYNEIGPWLALPILLLMAILLIARKEGLVFSILIFLVSSSFNPHCVTAEDLPLPTLRESYEAYQRGDFVTAERGFEAALKEAPGNSDIAQSLASAKFKLKQFTDAARSFDALAAGATTGREKFEALYNSGNSYLMQQKYNEAIQRYEEALKIKPQDTPATTNLEIAKRQRQSQQEQQKKNDSSSSSSAQSSSSKNSQGESSSSTSDSPDNNSSSANSGVSSEDPHDSSSSDNSGTENSESTPESASSKSSSSGSPSSAGQGSSSSNSGANESSSSSSETGEHAEESNGAHSASADPFKALDALEDTPLLPKQRRNRDNQDPTGQTW